MSRPLGIEYSGTFYFKMMIFKPSQSILISFHRALYRITVNLKKEDLIKSWNKYLICQNQRSDPIFYFPTGVCGPVAGSETIGAEPSGRARMRLWKNLRRTSFL